MSETNATQNGTAQPWAELYAEAEKLWTEPIQDFMGSDFFVKWLEVGREVYLAQTEVSRESLERYWDAVRLPHKGDIAGLAGQVVTVESKVEAIDERLEAMGDRLGALVGMVEALSARPADRKAAGKE